MAVERERPALVQVEQVEEFHRAAEALDAAQALPAKPSPKRKRGPEQGGGDDAEQEFKREARREPLLLDSAIPGLVAILGCDDKAGGAQRSVDGRAFPCPVAGCGYSAPFRRYLSAHLRVHLYEGGAAILPHPALHYIGNHYE